MDTTRASLLLRLRDHNDSEAWDQFVSLYRPILIRCARARGLDAEDAEDVAQHCSAAVSRKIADFDYDPRRGRFRGWLRKMVNDRVCSLLRRRGERPAESGDFERPQERERSPEEVWEQIWLEEHLRHCCERVRQRVGSRTYEAFRRVAVDQCSVKEVCAALDMTANQMYVAKSRVTRRLQDMMKELVGDDE